MSRRRGYEAKVARMTAAGRRAQLRATKAAKAEKRQARRSEPAAPKS